MVGLETALLIAALLRLADRVEFTTALGSLGESSHLDGDGTPSRFEGCVGRSSELQPCNAVLYYNIPYEMI